MKLENTFKIVLILTLTLGLNVAALCQAHEPGETNETDPHKGLILGINFGSGNSSHGYHHNSRTVINDGKEVGMGALRFGYSFNSTFALTLEGFGFGSDNCGNNENEEWGIGAGFLAATWHPGGHGFFLRSGIGGGGGEFYHPITKSKIELKEKGAILFSLGYDWRLGDSLTLGFSLDSMAIDAGNTLGPGDDFIGSSSLAVQFNWYI